MNKSVSVILCVVLVLTATSLASTIAPNKQKQDAQYAGVPLTAVWSERAQMPYTPSWKNVRDGGWLAYDAGTDLVYAAKGNKVRDFYWYNPGSNVWTPSAHPWPDGTEGKKPYKGAAACSDGNGHIYAIKGNNSLGFWEYFADGDSWHQCPDVPIGGGRKVKDGSDIVYVEEDGVGYVYLMKYPFDFHRYNTISQTWSPCQSVPGLQRLKAGSFLVYDGNGSIYLHKSYYDLLYKYDITQGSWSDPQPGMPYGYWTSRRAKRGSCGAWLDGYIYALKGANTTEFWRYDPEANSWTQLTPIPDYGSSGRRKRVYGGADLVAAGGLFALKGNNCREFWRYSTGQQGEGQVAARHFTSGGSAAASGGPTLGGELPLMDGIEASSPRWNWQGTRVCYSKTDTLTNREQIYQCQYPLSSAEQRVVDMDEDCEEPVYSPNGLYIAFQLDDTVSGFYQLCVTTASDTGPVLQVTFADADHCYPEWSLNGQWLCYERDDDSGYTQIWRVLAFGGIEEQLTFGNSDHFLPSYLNSDEIAFVLSPNDDYDQIAKVHDSTLQVTVLSTFETDHARPSPAWAGLDVAAEALDDSGTCQIVRMSGPNGETWLTSGTSDIMAPDYGQDNLTIFAVRWTGVTSQIVWVDALNGGYTAVTDSLAIRDNPDAHVDTVVSTALAVYEREAWGPEGLLLGGGGRRRRGAGVYLSRFRVPKKADGAQGAALSILALDKAKPNPATDGVTIRWQVPVEADVSLCVYNTSGQLVKVLADGKAKPGVYTSVWNGTDAKGRHLANGVYIYALDNGTKRISRKVVLAD
jgi:hypothetical protein